MKKLIWILLLIIVVAGIIFGLSYTRKNDKADDLNISKFNKETNKIEQKSIKENLEYVKTELSDGVLYSINGEIYSPDIVIGDNYFDTTINDIYFNPDTYYNKNIEIEGMYLQNLEYTFVGRYSISNLCAYCPPGYSYLEYQLKGKIDANFTDEKDWIKVIGTLAKGNDETSNNQDYYYLNVLSLEVMNKRGQETVSN